MSHIENIAEKIAIILIREGLDYNQTKTVFKIARQKAGLKREKQKGGSIERLTLEEEIRFINQAYQESGRTGLMMQALLETGCRVSEFIELRIEDISFAERLIIIQNGKGGKRREVPIRVELAKLLQLHIGHRRKGWLFQSRQKPYQYSRQRIGQIVRNIARKTEITKRIYPHLLRHTMATKLLNLGMDIAQVRLFLGHEDISSTQHYALSSTVTLQRQFDKLITGEAQQLINSIEQKHGADTAVFATELLLNK